MLYLIGLGIWDEKDLSLKGLEACKKAGEIYAELYTADWGGSLRNLERLAGKKITVVGRSDLEENSEKFLKRIGKKDVVLLVPGDPLVATTHSHLILEAKKFGVVVEIIHSSSIYSAIAKTGLQIYKFGYTVTIPKPQKGYNPQSFYSIIKRNLNSGLHSLILLDRDMDTKLGLDILLEIEKKRGQGVVSPNKKILICSKLGSDREKIIYGGIKDLFKKTLPSPAVIIIPGKLHFLEKEFLERFDFPSSH